MADEATNSQELMGKILELEQANNRIREELAVLRGESQSLTSPQFLSVQTMPSEQYERAKRNRKGRSGGRRTLLRRGLGVAAATIGTGVLFGMSSEKANAQTNGTLGPTTFNNNGSNSPAITANSSNTLNAIVATSSGYTGIAGKTTKTSNKAAGVYGVGPNVGVSGQVQNAIPNPANKVAVYGAGSSGSTLNAIGVQGDSDMNNGVLGTSISYTGVAGKTQSTSISAAGVYGQGGVVGVAGQVTGANTLPYTKVGVFGTAANLQQNPSVGGVGVLGESDTYYGVSGTSTGGGQATDSAGVAGFTTSTSSTDAGVLGEGPNGIIGLVTGAVKDSLYGTVGVYGSGSSGQNGSSLYGIGVQGVSDSGTGVFGMSTQGSYGVGVEGNGGQEGTGLFGVASGTSGWGVYGNGDGIGIYAESDYGTGLFSYSPYTAGEFDGNVDVNGTLTKSGGAFKIDHPLDPANKYLYHSFVESPEMKNVYDGVVTLDAQGEAVVSLPHWFDALNTSFRYQLTPIGAPAPNLYIAAEISNNHFKIAGGAAGMNVCWQVTGNRQDAWAKAHPIPVEQDKSGSAKGHYLHPALYGHPSDPDIMVASHATAKQRHKPHHK